MTFQELATKAHDLEMTITNHHGKSSSSYEFKIDKSDFKKSSKPPKASTNEAMTVSTREPVRLLGKSKSLEKKASYLKETINK